MKVKRAKANKRAMNIYVKSFNFRKPFQVLVDAEFIQVALDQKIDPVHQIPKVLLDTAKQMVTPCTVAKLRSLGDDAFGAFLAAKRLEKRRCPHQEAIDEHECLAQIIGDDNKHRYLVGSQSKKLRARFRQVPGVPLLYIHRSVLILEPPSEATTLKMHAHEKSKTHVTPEELARLKATTIKSNGKVVVDKKVAEKIEKLQEKKKEKRAAKKAEIAKKRKGVKEPNPLSVKKKKEDKKGPTSSSLPSSKPETGATPATKEAGAPAPVVLTGAEKKKQKKKEAKKLKRKLQHQQQGGMSSAGDDSDSS